MDFSFTPEQEAMRETARRFAEDRLRPGYQEREKEGRMDPTLVREMGELGLIGCEFPEELGGLGLDCVTTGLILEEICRADFNLGYVQILGSLNGNILRYNANPELTRKWLPRVCRGEALIAIALTEPRGGSDAAHLQLKARRDGDFYILSGEKTSISLADQADVAVTFARTNPDEPGARGVSAFLVHLDSRGITRTRFQDVGEHIVGRVSVFFDDVRVPADHLIGGEGGGFAQAMRGFDFSRALIGLQCLAAAEASVAETWEYVASREAFGRPLSSFEGVSFPLAEAETRIAAARLLCYRALWLKDQGKPHTAEAAMCKWWAPRLSFEAIHDCLLLHGHSGYGMDMPHQQRLRDVLGGEIGDGTAQIMKLIIARERIGRAGIPYAWGKQE